MPCEIIPFIKILFLANYIFYSLVFLIIVFYFLILHKGKINFKTILAYFAIIALTLYIKSPWPALATIILIAFNAGILNDKIINSIKECLEAYRKPEALSASDRIEKQMQDEKDDEEAEYYEDDITVSSNKEDNNEQKEDNKTAQDTKADEEKNFDDNKTLDEWKRYYKKDGGPDYGRIERDGVNFLISKTGIQFETDKKLPGKEGSLYPDGIKIFPGCDCLAEIKTYGLMGGGLVSEDNRLAYRLTRVFARIRNYYNLNFANRRVYIYVLLVVPEYMLKTQGELRKRVERIVEKYPEFRISCYITSPDKL